MLLHSVLSSKIVNKYVSLYFTVIKVIFFSPASIPSPVPFFLSLTFCHRCQEMWGRVSSTDPLIYLCIDTLPLTFSMNGDMPHVPITTLAGIASLTDCEWHPVVFQYNLVFFCNAELICSVWKDVILISLFIPYPLSYWLLLSALFLTLLSCPLCLY